MMLMILSSPKMALAGGFCEAATAGKPRIPAGSGRRHLLGNVKTA
jgi:hypothetical protein